MRETICVFLFMFGVALGQNFIVGVGIEDVTGPAADVNMVSFFLVKRSFCATLT